MNADCMEAEQPRLESLLNDLNNIQQSYRDVRDRLERTHTKLLGPIPSQPAAGNIATAPGSPCLVDSLSAAATDLEALSYQIHSLCSQLERL